MKPAAVIVTRRLGWSPRRLREAGEAGLPWIAVQDEAFSKMCETLPVGDTKAFVSLRIAAPRTQPVTLRNVAGMLPGSDPALEGQFVLLTAHYDHNGVRGPGEGDRIYNGANDNASGTASIIELASALAGMEPKPKRSILFVAFFGEERGFLGSGYYTRHPLRPLANTVANINLEHLGRTDDSEGPQVGRAAVTGFDYSDVGETLHRAGQLTGIEVVRHPKNSDQFFGASDNLSFAQAGIPAHTLAVSFLFPDYHRPGDEWQKLDYGNMAKVNRMIAAGLVLVANNPERPKWNTANPKVERYVKAAKELHAVPSGNGAADANPGYLRR
jgi:Zn-dependent M28 family amino/carboxypeptidase